MTTEQLEQRMTALAQANEIRCGRAELKREVRAGAVSVAQAMQHDHCQSMKLVDLLVCVPKVGRVKAMKAISRLGVSPSRRIDELTERQLASIVQVMSR